MHRPSGSLFLTSHLPRVSSRSSTPWLWPCLFFPLLFLLTISSWSNCPLPGWEDLMKDNFLIAVNSVKHMYTWGEWELVHVRDSKQDGEWASGMQTGSRGEWFVFMPKCVYALVFMSKHTYLSQTKGLSSLISCLQLCVQILKERA